MVVEFQKKGGKREAYEALNWIEALWYLTDAEDGIFYLKTVKLLKVEGLEDVIDGIKGQDNDLAVMEWNLKNGDLYYAGIKGEVPETLFIHSKHKLARGLCQNQEFLKSLELHYLKVDGDFILEWCKPENPLMPNELRFF